jgi:hypothetical protein
MTVEKHDQNVTHHYTVHYPAHPERNSDPHYKDFNHYRKQTKATAKCSVGDHRNDFSECTLDKPLELHHSHIEFSLQNGVDLKWLEVDYPGISDPDTIGAWVESANNLVWLCEFHHRGFGGAHTASASDYEAEKYVRGLMYTEPDPKAVQVRLPNPPETII